MPKNLFFLLLLSIPLCVLTYAAHVLISSEMHRGREVGRAFLRSKAQLMANEVKKSASLAIPLHNNEPKVLISIVNDKNESFGDTIPDDGRCTAKVSLMPEFKNHFLVAAWPGKDNPGLQRKRKLIMTEIAVCAISLSILLITAYLMIRSSIRQNKEAQKKIDLVNDFSHRLKTPITSISICAELSLSEHIDTKRKLECAQTIASEAVKLDNIVNEILWHIEGKRNG